MTESCCRDLTLMWFFVCIRGSTGSDVTVNFAGSPHSLSLTSQILQPGSHHEFQSYYRVLRVDAKGSMRQCLLLAMVSSLVACFVYSDALTMIFLSRKSYRNCQQGSVTVRFQQPRHGQTGTESPALRPQLVNIRFPAAAVAKTVINMTLRSDR